MKTTTRISLAIASLAVAAARSDAAIIVNDLSGLPTLSPTNTSVTGISVAPFEDSGGRTSTLYASYGAPSFTVAEEGPYHIGVGGTVPLGEDLTSFQATPGQQLTFSDLKATGRYFAPFYKDPMGGSPNGPGYLTFDFDNSTKSITFVSSTVQTEAGQTLTVVPEPTVTLLGGLGALLLLRSRR